MCAKLKSYVSGWSCVHLFQSLRSINPKTEQRLGSTLSLCPMQVSVEICVYGTHLSRINGINLCAHAQCFLFLSFTGCFLHRKSLVCPLCTPKHTNTCALNKSPQTVARKSRIDLDTTTVSSEICFFFRKMLLREAFKRFQAVHLVFQRNKH